MPRFTSLVVAVAFLQAVSMLVPSAAVANRSEPHYLYVGTRHGVFRFPFSDGTPSSVFPDRFYEDVVAPIAVSGEGVLYATKRPTKAFSIQRIREFPPESNHFSRELVLPFTCCDGTAALALAVHPNGNLYVSYTYEVNGRSRLARAAYDRRVPLSGVAVYVKGAGATTPAKTFALPHGGSPGGMTFGPNGRLYAVMNTRDITQFLDIADVDQGAPALLFTRRFAEQQYATGIALDDAGNVFAFAPGGFEANAKVYAFTPFGAGPMQLDHVLVIPRNEPACCGIAIDEGNLFVEDSFQVLGYRTTDRKLAQPFFFFTLRGAIDVALGG